MERGYDHMMPLGKYTAAPSANFNNGQFQNALQDRIDNQDDVLFPIYDTLTGPGSNAEYNIIGWVAFHITSFDNRGVGGEINGYFTETIWRGQINPGQATTPNFGVRTIALID
jgi:hypothetical protein